MKGFGVNCWRWHLHLLSVLVVWLYLLTAAAALLDYILLAADALPTIIPHHAEPYYIRHNPEQSREDRSVHTLDYSLVQSISLNWKS